MSKFDLAAAKRGDVVQIKYVEGWFDAHFVGVSACGKRAVFEYNKSLFSRSIDDKSIRMKPKKRQMWCFPYINSLGHYETSPPFGTKGMAEKASKDVQKKCGDVQMIFVDEE